MKTIKTIRIISLVALFAIFTDVTVANSNSTAYVAAKKDLNKMLHQTIKKDFSKLGNFLYNNDINYLDEVVKIVVRVDDFQEVKLLKAYCKNCDATGYIKDLFKKGHMKADPLLKGKAFKIDIHLVYTTK